MLTLGSLALLMLFTLNLNSGLVHDQVLVYQSEQMIEAVALAQRFIEEADRLQFDEDASASVPSSFTSAAELGPESGESYPQFDDIDDFDGYETQIAVPRSITWNVEIMVHYVDPSDYSHTTSRTYFKEMVVTVSSEDFSGDPSFGVALKRIFAYHYFFTE